MSDTPRTADGAKLCAWCGGEIRQSGIGRSKDYCRRSCRQRAYEARKQREVVVAAVAAAIVRRDSSRDATRKPNDSSRDESVRAGRAPVPAPAAPPVPQETPAAVPPAPADPGEGWVRSIDVVDAQLRELDARRAAPPPVQQKRRRLAAPPPMEAPTLFEPEAADGE
ncbi:hypothetical protein PV443_44595 [Streptomyces scabiei]|uniref:hypothetical protein n=1 Tax=Streptomyces scabiei TaxID=1930 RepID=UPI0029B4DFB2|nr:hypothetical protein [Streptomyces scabiei]MDX2872135.1 hypothetical protein [Streptomyces scabiei]